MDLINKLYEDVKNFDSNIRIVNSKTNFGNSNYLYIGPFKVRESDHDCGTFRILSELHLHNVTYKLIFEQIERYFFPERYEKVVFMGFSDVFEIGTDVMNNTHCEIKVIVLNNRITAKGRQMSLIQRRNKEITTYIKK